MQPWLFAASSVRAPGFQHTALMNWLPSAEACPPRPLPGLENSRLAIGLASAL